MKKYNIAIVGATGNVGAQFLQILAERNFPVNKIEALASDKSAGKNLSYGEDKILTVHSLNSFDFTGIDIVLSSAGAERSRKFASKALEKGATIIDNSSCFRMDKDVALIVPEVNRRDIDQYTSKIIANPNCCVIPLVIALKPLDNEVKIKRIVISTYQSVSGAGKKAMDELYNQTKGVYTFQEKNPFIFPKAIAFNLFPHIGDFDEESGETSEEQKIVEETCKIMGRNIPISVTCVRVPTFIGHCLSVNIEFESEITPELAYEILGEQDHIVTNDKEKIDHYITPSECAGSDFVFVSRIRSDLSKPNSLNMWIASDNLRKGAALNAIQIAELLINR